MTRSSGVRKSLSAAFAVIVVGLSIPAVAGAAPKNYCADIKGIDTGTVCQIQLTDPRYTVDISVPSNFPDMKALTQFVAQTRDSFLNVARSSAPREAPYVLDITAATYNSYVPPRGQLSVVLKVYENVGAAYPQTSFKSFVWDQAYRKLVTYQTLWQPEVDPLPIVFPAVQNALQNQTGQPVPIAPAAGLDPANYQNFAITNDGVIFFFNQGGLLPEAAGTTQVLVPRAVIDPLLA
jgi:hypothetical protein